MDDDRGTKAVDTIADAILKAVNVKSSFAKTELRDEMKRRNYLPVVSDNDNNRVLLANASKHEWKKKNLYDLIYPVGSVYLSINNTNPAGNFGGTWTSVSCGLTGVYAWKRTA